jgi:hypothetical protein
LDSGTNNNIVAPTIASAAYNSNKTALIVTGTFTATTANVTYILDFYEAPANDLEGKLFVGALYVTPATTGTQSFTATTSFSTAYPDMLATLTDGADDTSEYSIPTVINFS